MSRESKQAVARNPTIGELFLPSRRWAAAAAGLLVMISGLSCRDRRTAPTGGRLRPAVAVLYPEVAPIFSKHCNRCHDKNQSDNNAAMAVFESSRYPFATERADTLLSDLREMFHNRGSLSRSEKRTALDWLASGARDAKGRLPVWRAPD